MTPIKLGPDPQTARINSGPGAMKQVADDAADEAKSAAEKYREQAMQKLKRLGVAVLYDDLQPDNPTLMASLAKIRAAGAPEPIVERVIVANQGGQWQFDLYHFPRPMQPGVRYSANETLLALSPNTVIGDLRAGGFLGGE